MCRTSPRGCVLGPGSQRSTINQRTDMTKDSRSIRVALIAGGNRHKTVDDVGVTCNNGVAQNQAGAIRHHRREVDKGQTQELWPQVMGSRNNTSQSSQSPVGQTRSDSASRPSHFGRLRLGTGTPTSRVLPLLRRDRDYDLSKHVSGALFPRRGEGYQFQATDIHCVGTLPSPSGCYWRSPRNLAGVLSAQLDNPESRPTDRLW